MEISRLLDESDWIEGYEMQEYRRWSDGFYRKIKKIFVDKSVLFAREYVDASERNYSSSRFLFDLIDNPMIPMVFVSSSGSISFKRFRTGSSLGGNRVS